MLEPFEIKRSAGMYVSVVVLAGIIGTGFIGFAYLDNRGRFWWVIGAVLLVAALVHAIALIGVRTPIFVADEHGVRLRDRAGWTGIPWVDMDEIRIVPRRGLWSDPRIKVISRDGFRVHSCPIGFATTVSPRIAQYELSRRRDRGTAMDLKV